MSEQKILSVGLIGYGYWGKKLTRVLKDLGVLLAIADSQPSKLQEALDSGIMKAKHLLGCYEDLAEEELDAAVIATPPETHYQVAKWVLENGLHAFIEKPLTTRYEEAKELEELAMRKNLTLQVGHIYLHSAALKAIPIPVGPARLHVRLLNKEGPPSSSTRDILWAGLPHALSVALHFFNTMPWKVEAWSREGTVYVHLDWFGRDRGAWLEVGDYTGERARQVELRMGDELYHFTADRPGFLHKVQEGIEVYGTEPLVAEEPLVTEMKHFLESPGVDSMGSKVVRIIERVVSCLLPVH